MGWGSRPPTFPKDDLQDSDKNAMKLASQEEWPEQMFLSCNEVI